jgi:2-keto-3-deoxy-L-rhamnonate aldolase RhmA
VKMPNTLHRKIAAGEPTVGTHFLSTDPDIPEIIGDTGLFDYAEFCAEYTVFDMPMLAHLARAGQAGNLPLIIKPYQACLEFWAQAAMGAGFDGILFTDIRTPDDVTAAYAAVRPDLPGTPGRMGVKVRRSAMTGYEVTRYQEALDSVVLMIMIEKAVAVRDLDAILKVAAELGVAMTQWGPADFALSYGQPGLAKLPEIRSFEEQVIAKSIECGVAPRVEIQTVESAKRYVDLGVRHFCIGWDRFILQAELNRLGEGMRAIVANL